MSAKQRYRAKHARIPGLHLITRHSHFCVDLLAVACHPAGERKERYPQKWGSSTADALIQSHSGVCSSRDKPGNGLRAEISLINAFDCSQHCTGAGYMYQKLFHMVPTHSVRQLGLHAVQVTRSDPILVRGSGLTHYNIGCCRGNPCLLTDSYLMDQRNYFTNFTSFQISL